MVLAKMNTKWIKYAIILALMTLIQGARAQSAAKIEKRIDKLIASVFAEQAVTRQQLDIPVDIFEAYGMKDSDRVFQLSSEGQRVGIMVLTSSKGRYEEFDYAVLYDPERRIQGIDVLVYRSDHGHEIMNKGWLKQFYGTDGCGLEYGKEIDAVSGATFSASSLTLDLGRWCKILGSFLEDKGRE